MLNHLLRGEGKIFKRFATLGSEPPKRLRIKKDELDDLKDEESD